MHVSVVDLAIPVGSVVRTCDVIRFLTGAGCNQTLGPWGDMAHGKITTLGGSPGSLWGSPGSLRGSPGSLWGSPGSLWGSPGSLWGSQDLCGVSPGPLCGGPVSKSAHSF